MFFDNIFTSDKYDEILFIGVESFSVTFSSYAHCKSLSKANYLTLSILLIDEIKKKSGTANYDQDIVDISERILREILSIDPNSKIVFGYVVFIVNLFIKKIAGYMKPSDRERIRAPLNRAELHLISYPKVDGISKVTKHNFHPLMVEADEYARGLKKYKPPKSFKSLYEWELWFWNNN